MPKRIERRKDELIDAVVELIQGRLGQDRAEQVERFARAFYANVPPDDIARSTPEQLYGAAMSIWQFAGRRPPGAARVRVYNPRIESSAWQSSRTVVEVINDDMPFLVDSVSAELNRLGLTVHLVIHPVMRVVRDDNGELLEIHPKSAAPEGAKPESVMHFQVNPVSEPARLEAATASIHGVLRDVRASVEDWATMRDRARDAIAEMTASDVAAREGAGGDEVGRGDEAREAADFLTWINNDHFTYLGYREYGFSEPAEGEGEPELTLVDGSGLGILRDDKVTVFDGLRHFSSLPPDVRAFIRAPRLLMVSKGNRHSTVHRPVPIDAILVKRFDENGRCIGERLFAGLFTSAAYNRTPREIPFLRRKISAVLARGGFDARSHDGKALVNILETYPRDDLFQIEVEELFDIAIGILHLQERQRLALFVRRDPFERFVSCLVYVPRDRYDTALRRRFQSLLEDAFGGVCEAFFTQLTEGVLARVQFLIKTEPGKIVAVDVQEVEERLTQWARGWNDQLRDALLLVRGEEVGLSLFARYDHAFPAGYKETFTAEQAVYDIERIENTGPGQLGINLYRPLEADPTELHFKVYHVGKPVALSDILPMLEHMDLRVITEIPFEVTPAGRDAPVWIHDFTTTTHAGADIDGGGLKERFQEAFAAVWTGRAEDDGFSRLVLRAGLTVREVALVRAMAKYLRQARIAYGQDTIEATLAAHPAITRAVVRLFHTLHDPARRDGADDAELAIMSELTQALDKVTNLDEDRVFRRIINLVMSTLRTNFYQLDAAGLPKSHIVLKLDSQSVTDLPLPRPWVEVFVYSPRMEGVHLRGGPVARGGLRWSDRREDFRTEILGLMKAQMVKNTVIVPVGSKGGFVVKRPPPPAAGREAFLAEGIECYKTLIRGLLDVTDNLDAEGGIVPPPDVVRKDGDDPYLVVAADKGTATFSDIANGVSVDHGFWLGDAFASGGSAGYDHKKMGITAKGAWECVKRHFRELGHDTQTQPFTVVGVGDMSGDVFGNGMLLSRHIKLVAAFDHRHIFLDPDPDPEISWNERSRLFNLPRSSWADYDGDKMSKGARIFPRDAKSLHLTPEIKARFCFTRDDMAPQELLHALLMAEVDLLWFGGIGTYVKASHESHVDAGDKANDAIRVDAGALRCKVVGEGANLGMTQRARIEASRRGVLLNTDAIDNSAGVDTSDHEVNIKILLGDVVRRGDMTAKQRDHLLAEMTDEVASLVLADNYLQSQAITVARARAAQTLDDQARFMRQLEKAGLLNRAIEYLPDDEEIAIRQARDEGLTRPELAVVLAYAKLTLYDAILGSDLPDDPFMADDLARYFPKALRKGFVEAIERHQLRREIIATSVTNSLINRGGPTFVKDMMDKTGFGPADVSRAYAIVRDVFNLRPLWTAIEDLDNKAPASVQVDMIVATQALMTRAVAWFLTNAAHPLDVAAVTAAYRPGIEALAADLDRVLDAEEAGRLAERRQSLIDRGAPEDLATRFAALGVLAAGPDLVLISQRTGDTLERVASIHFLLGRRFGLEWLRDRAACAKAENHWSRQALSAIIDDLFGQQTHLTARVLEAWRAGGDGDHDPIEMWAAGRRTAVERAEALLTELRGQGAIDLAMLAVANRQLRGLTSV